MHINRKYHPWNAKAQSWDYIENRFSTDFGGANIKMIELVRHIKNSDLSKRLFGSTSMEKLVVGNDNSIDYRKESLHIRFDLLKNVWHFEYYAEPFKEPEFVRTYSADKGIEKFDNFIKMIRW